MRFAVAGVVALCVAQGALANDLAGFRVEGLLGWDRPDDWLFDKADGLLFGVGAGYDFALGETMALGVDAELSGSTSRQDLELCGPNPDCLVVGRSEPGRDLYVGARFTGKVADRIAVFAKAGYANVEVKARYFDEATYGPPFRETLDGWRGGFGAQYLWGKWYAGLEYRYTDYGDGALQVDGPTRHQLVGNVGVRF